VPPDLSAPKTALCHPQEHATWVRPSPSSTIVVRCSIVVAAPVPLALTVLPRLCAGSAGTVGYATRCVTATRGFGGGKKISGRTRYVAVVLLGLLRCASPWPVPQNRPRRGAPAAGGPAPAVLPVQAGLGRRRLHRASGRRGLIRTAPGRRRDQTHRRHHRIRGAGPPRSGARLAADFKAQYEQGASIRALAETTVAGPTVSCARCSRKLTCPCAVGGAPDDLDRADHRGTRPAQQGAKLWSPVAGRRVHPPRTPMTRAPMSDWSVL